MGKIDEVNDYEDGEKVEVEDFVEDSKNEEEEITRRANGCNRLSKSKESNHNKTLVKLEK